MRDYDPIQVLRARICIALQKDLPESQLARQVAFKTRPIACAAQVPFSGHRVQNPRISSSEFRLHEYAVPRSMQPHLCKSHRLKIYLTM